MRKALTHHTDPGHGWLEVPRDDLTALGVAHEISACSYQDEANAYLEEDAYAGVQGRVARAEGWRVEARGRYVGGGSFVRHLPSPATGRGACVLNAQRYSGSRLGADYA